VPSPRKTAKTHEIAIFPSKSGQPVILIMVMLLEMLIMVNKLPDMVPDSKFWNRSGVGV